MNEAIAKPPASARQTMNDLEKLLKAAPGES
jgi:carbon monoxide dehydrogenase subunit G